MIGDDSDVRVGNVVPGHHRNSAGTGRTPDYPSFSDKLRNDVQVETVSQKDKTRAAVAYELFGVVVMVAQCEGAVRCGRQKRLVHDTFNSSGSGRLDALPMLFQSVLGLLPKQEKSLNTLESKSHRIAIRIFGPSYFHRRQPRRTMGVTYNQAQFGVLFPKEDGRRVLQAHRWHR